MADGRDHADDRRLTVAGEDAMDFLADGVFAGPQAVGEIAG